VAFPATVTDSIPAGVGDITSSWINLTFGNGNVFRYPAIAGPGTAFDNVLTRGSPAPVQVTPSIPNFVKNLQPNGGVAVAALAAVDNASAVTVAAQDSAHNIGSLTFTFVPGTPQLVAGSAAVLATNFSGGWTITADTAKVSNCAGCATPTQPLSAVLKATAKGTTATFVNPFAGGQVSFWYRVNGSGTPWFFIGNAGAGSSRDDGINRFWDYTLTFTPPLVAPDGTVLTGNGTLLDVIAVGVNTAGDGVMTTVIQPITLFNP
jgi:hypothetical protein